MGYRSNWQLGITAADEDLLEKTLQWMKDYATVVQTDVSEEERSIMELILNSEQTRDDTHIIFGDDWTKCYTPWDTVIAQIRDYVDQNPELDMGYARLGEDYEDVEVHWGNGYATPQIVRTIDGFDISPPPKVKAQSATATTSTRQEEKCNSCGRMKDAGHTCWWCGH